MSAGYEQISAVVICLNEEHHIGACIRSLQLVTDDIVVVLDSRSDDRSGAIAQELGARVFIRAWTGYADQKNFGSRQALHPYILAIDADECLSKELAECVNREMIRPGSAVYKFRFITSWQGRFVYRGSWACEMHCRLYDKRKISWDTRKVHEELMIKNYKPGILDGFVYHHTARSKKYYRDKMEHYALLFANTRRENGRFSPFWKKYLSAFFRFLKDYLFSRGFLEGKAGWEIAFEETRYTFLKYKWSERKGRQTT